MKKSIRISLAIVGTLCFCAMVLSATGMVPDTGWLHSLVGFFGAGGVISLAEAGVTPNNETIVKGETGVEVGDISTKKPDYLKEDYDKALVKIAPSQTPFDTITRTIGNSVSCAGVRTGGFEIGTRDVDDTVAADTVAGQIVSLQVGKEGMWLKNDVIVVGSDTLLDDSGNPLCLLVVGQGDTLSVLKVRAINEKYATSIPVIAKDTPLLRLSNAVNEHTAKVPTWDAIPAAYSNYCQTHMRMVSETVLHSLVDKEVNYDMALMKEMSLYEMKCAMERTNILGVKGVTKDGDGKPVYTSQGLMYQCDQESTLTVGAINNKAFNSLAREVFDGTNGSNVRVFIPGSDMLEAMSNNVEMIAKQLEAQKSEVVYGVKFHRIETNWGDFLIRPMGALLTGPWAKYGLIVDPQFLVKKVLEPLQTEEMDLNKTGQDRSDAVRLHETYCLILNNKPCHRRVKLVTA